MNLQTYLHTYLHTCLHTYITHIHTMHIYPWRCRKCKARRKHISFIIDVIKNKTAHEVITGNHQADQVADNMWSLANTVRWRCETYTSWLHTPNEISKKLESHSSYIIFVQLYSEKMRMKAIESPWVKNWTWRQKL